MGRKLVCLCNLVSEAEIMSALKKGARTTREIQQLTSAGTSCGRCLVQIDMMVEEYLASQPVDPQQRIGFDS